MSARVSRSVIDPIVGPRLQSLYPHLSIPKWFPPEGIVLIGHLSAIAGALGLAFSVTTWWGGLLAATGIAGNHLADCIDGTHARRTGQCRNGGELLDHFTDPLSFAYYLIGIGVALGRLDLALVAVVCLFAVAVLTNIKAKLTGRFELSRFGPTEFKAMLVATACITSTLQMVPTCGVTSTLFLTTVYISLIAIGVIYVPVQLWRSVVDVNRNGEAPDTSEWELKKQ